ncbi:MAG: hypothetical protein J6T63_03805 [Bacteroidales bacterium]|nr:hypothetical protein [Bacteroidales bacterium]
MKKIVLISILVVAIGVIGFVGCEREEIEKPTLTTNLRLLEDSITGYYQNEDTIRTPEDTTESYQNEEDPDIVKGHVVALLGPCEGYMMVISVENDTIIGTNQDLYGNDWYGIFDTLFVYNNVIGLPFPIDFFNYQPEYIYRYVFNGDTLRSIEENDYFEFKCHPIDMDTEYSLLFASNPCLDYWSQPTNMNLFKITEIKKYIKK